MRSCFSMRRWSGVKLCAQNSFCKVLFISMFLFCPCKYSCEKTRITLYTILDKTVEKIVYLDSIFLNIAAVPVLPSPPSPESNVVVYSKENLIPGRLWEATLNWGKGFSFRKGVVLEIVLLLRKVDMMGKTFSSSFVRDCRCLPVWDFHLPIRCVDVKGAGLQCGDQIENLDQNPCLLQVHANIFFYQPAGAPLYQGSTVTFL